MKSALLLSGLLAVSSALPLVAQNVTTPPTPTTPPNTQGPCGNPSQPEPPDCLDCETANSNQFKSPVGSSCEATSINSYNGNGHRKTTDLDIAGSVGNMPLRFTRYSNTRLSTRNLTGG